MFSIVTLTHCQIAKLLRQTFIASEFGTLFASSKTSAYLIIPFIGTENLLYVAATLSSISLLLLNSLFKNIVHNNPQVQGKKTHATHSIKNIQAALTGDLLIRKIAIVSFFSFAIYLIANFIFYGYVKAAFTTDKSLVSFFAIAIFIINVTSRVIPKNIAKKLTNDLSVVKAALT